MIWVIHDYGMTSGDWNSGRRVCNMETNLVKIYRLLLKDSIRMAVDFSQTDQNRGILSPPLGNPFPADAQRIDLPHCDQFAEIGGISLKAAIENRESRRNYSHQPLSLEELAFLLWAVRGIRERLDSGHVLRTVPSAGCRHAIETYLFIQNICGLLPGIYCYLPLQHQLLFEFTEDGLNQQIRRASLG
mgnify:CR=1 FL=1